MASRAQATVITDHEEIRRWAEERGAKPACVFAIAQEGSMSGLALSKREDIPVPPDRKPQPAIKEPPDKPESEPKAPVREPGPTPPEHL